jgi:hypothetical protein
MNKYLGPTFEDESGVGNPVATRIIDHLPIFPPDEVILRAAADAETVANKKGEGGCNWNEAYSASFEQQLGLIQRQGIPIDPLA